MYEPSVLIPLVINFPTLAILDDIAVVPLPLIEDGAGRVQLDYADWAFTARALTSGTATLVIKRNDGTIIGTASLTVPGTVVFRPSQSTLAMGNRLRFGLSGIGVGLLDVSVVGWIKLPCVSPG